MTSPARPAPVTRDRAGILRAAAAAVTGRPLTAVTYRMLDGADWPRYHARGRLDEVDMAVLLDFPGGVRLAVSWAMEGFTQGLGLLAGPPEELPPRPGQEADYQADGTGPWAGLLGRVLTDIQAAWLPGDWQADEAVWALRLTFADGEQPVIALGEAEDGAPQYQPDNLVVFFDPDAADSYRAECESADTASPWEPARPDPG